MIDLREVFLERASARLLLYEAGAMTLDEAVNGLAPAFRHITGLAACDCAREMIERWERDDRRQPKPRKPTPHKPNISRNWTSKR
jgi:hypothetical protein